jgi:hypothetical protein
VSRHLTCCLQVENFFTLSRLVSRHLTCCLQSAAQLILVSLFDQYMQQPRGPNGRFLKLPVPPSYSSDDFETISSPQFTPIDSPDIGSMGIDDNSPDFETYPDATPSSTGPDSTRLARVESQLASLTRLLENLGHASTPGASSSPAPLPHASPPHASPGTAAGTASPATGFVGPSSKNPAAGESISVASHFPSVEAGTLDSILRHDFKPLDLHKLDTRLDRIKRETNVTVMDGSTMVSLRGDSSLKDYPNAASVTIPLLTYFGVLQLSVGAAESMRLAFYFNRYLSLLLRFAAEYEWPAVLAYHMDFHMHRRPEMRQGTYVSWSLVDQELLSQHLVGRSIRNRATAPHS